MGKPRFTWGDAVRVLSDAPSEMRAGEQGDVVAITEIDTPEKAAVYAASIGSTLYQVEFGDGCTVEIQEALLEAASK